MTEKEKISYIYCTHDLNFRPSLASYDDDDDASESSGRKVRMSLSIFNDLNDDPHLSGRMFL